MRINTNTAAMNTYSNLTSANASKSSSLAKLSSGLRINKAGDDAAGLAISEKMKNQVSGMTQASRNAQDGISLIQTAEGALGETHSILNRMRDLTVQAANGTNTDSDKTAIQAELTSLTEEVNRISGDTEFNTQGLMNATDGITASSLEKSGIKLADIVSAHNGRTTATTDDISVSDAGSHEKVAAALTKLSEADLKTVVDSYNVTQAAAINATAPTAPVAVNKGLATKESAVDSGEFIIDSTVVTDSTTQGELLDAYNADPNKTDVGSLDDIKFTSKADAEAFVESYNDKKTADYNKKSVEHAKTLANSQIESLDIQQASSKEFTFQIGANAGEKISVEIKNMSAKGLGIDNLDVTDKNQSTDQILGKLDQAISDVSSQRANLGAVQNRLDHTVSNLATTKENLSEANSRITDVDMAEEMMSFTKSNILSQASTSMLAQANQMPQSVLSLLQ